MIYENDVHISSTEPNGTFYISDIEEPAWQSTMKMKLQQYLSGSSFELYHYNLLRKYQFSVNGMISNHVKQTQNENLMKHVKKKYSCLFGVIQDALDIPVFQYGFPYFFDFWTLLYNYAKSCILDVSTTPITILNGRQKISLISMDDTLNKFLAKVVIKMKKYTCCYENKRKQLILDYNSIIQKIIRVRYLNKFILEFLFHSTEIRKLNI